MASQDDPNYWPPHLCMKLWQNTSQPISQNVETLVSSGINTHGKKHTRNLKKKNQNRMCSPMLHAVTSRPCCLVCLFFPSVYAFADSYGLLFSARAIQGLGSSFIIISSKNQEISEACHILISP